MSTRVPALLLLSALLPACGGDGGRDDASSGAPTQPTGVSSITRATDTADTTGQAPTDPGATDSAATDSAATSDAATTDAAASTTTTGAGTSSTGADPSAATTSVGDPSASETGFERPKCDPKLDATIRDFKVDHPDFEDFASDVGLKGLVQPTLGPDGKPVYAPAGPTAQTAGPGPFSQWYNNTPDTNIAFAVEIPLTEVMPGLYRYQNDTFFPIDDQGWGNEGNNHNFHFTTEIHTTFVYEGGEVFTFIGDDDLWMFLNGKLAIDLGGVHPQLEASVDLDAQAAALGITVGGTYKMDIFHAERHTDQSHFRIDTSIQCFIIPG